MEDVKQLCPRVIISNEGEKIYDDSYQNLVKSYAKEKDIEVTFEQKVTKKSVEKLGKIIHFDGVSALITVSRDDVNRVLESLVKDFKVADISIKEKEAAEVVADIFAKAKKV